MTQPNIPPSPEALKMWPNGDPANGRKDGVIEPHPIVTPDTSNNKYIETYVIPVFMAITVIGGFTVAKVAIHSNQTECSGSNKMFVSAGQTYEDVMKTAEAKVSKIDNQDPAKWSVAAFVMQHNSDSVWDYTTYEGIKVVIAKGVGSIAIPATCATPQN